MNVFKNQLNLDYCPNVVKREGTADRLSCVLGGVCEEATLMKDDKRLSVTFVHSEDSVTLTKEDKCSQTERLGFLLLGAVAPEEKDLEMKMDDVYYLCTSFKKELRREILLLSFFSWK